jgi:hypothetical protein
MFKSTCKKEKQRKLLTRLSADIHSTQDKLNAITKKRRGLPTAPTKDEKSLLKIISDKTDEHKKISRSCN